MKSKKGFFAVLEQPKKVVKYLQPYFYQGGKWYKLGGQSNGSKRILSKVSKIV